MDKFFEVDIKGYLAKLPVLPLPSGISIAFFNLHGNPSLTEHCGKKLAELAKGCDVLLTAESKGLQLTHVVARELNMEYYAVARKSKKLYMQDGISIAYNASITTGKVQEFYLSEHDVNLIKGKKIAIVDDVVSTGESLNGLIKLAEKAGAKVCKKLFVLAEGNAKDIDGVQYLATLPLFE